jgi:3-dehydroquinate dehydratase
MICVPIIAKNTGEAIETIARANTVADMLELRLDVMESFCLEDMVRESADGQIPVMQMRDILKALKG